MDFLIGQVVKVQTTADDFVRVTVDIPREACAAQDLISWPHESVRIGVLTDGIVKPR